MRKTLSSSSSSRVLQRGASGVARSFSSSSPMPPLQTMQPQTLQTIRRNASIRTRQQSKRKNFYGAFYISVLVVTAVFVTTFFLSLQRRVNQTRTMTSMNASTIDEKNTIASREHRDMLPSIPEKEPILQLLRDAGILELDAESVDRLPTWAKVT